MRFIYRLFPGFYAVKHMFFATMLSWVIISANPVVWSNILCWLLLGFCILLPTNFYSSFKQYSKYYAIIGLGSIVLAVFVSIIFVNVLQFVGLCALKSWILSDHDDPNYPLNVNFFNLGVIFLITVKIQPGAILMALYLLCNLICVILVDYIWSKHRIVGVLKH